MYFLKHAIWRYPRISLEEERLLIQKAQRGSKKSKDELVLRHVSFLIFRIQKIAFPHLAQRFRDDLLGDAILILYAKIQSYDLDYRDKQGNQHPVKFISYVWKRIDGFILDTLKKELNESNYYDRYSGYAHRNGDLSPMSGQREVDNLIS